MAAWGWKLHGTGRSVGPGEVVAPDERLSWPRTIGIGMQHVVAMFGATFLVPLITGFSPQTTLFFSAIGTSTASSRPIAIGPSSSRNAVHHQPPSVPRGRRSSTPSAAASSPVIMTHQAMA